MYTARTASATLQCSLLAGLTVLTLTACGGKADTTDSADTLNTSATTNTATGTGTTQTTGTSTGTTSTTTNPLCANGPLAQPIPNCAPPVAASTGDFGQDCVDRINQFRWECQCLPPLARWTEAEGCSDQQSADDQAINGAHAHFGACGEVAQNTCPNWASDEQVIDGCLQMMWDEGPGEPFIEHGHYINMSSLSYSKVACGHASNGGLWSNQNFTP